MATEEARTLLNSLMGPDRNAPLPKGAAIPGAGVDQTAVIRKRQKSCFDKDIDPLYTAWGVDVYELFVNTKADIGANPYVVDLAAHKEFQRLPEEEKERLGYNYLLFQKLQELVRQCDRSVQRSKEKLKSELSRKQLRGGDQHFVESIDPQAVDQLARSMVSVEEMNVDLAGKLDQLNEMVLKEEDRKERLGAILDAVRQREEAKDANNDDELQTDGTESTSLKEDTTMIDEERTVFKEINDFAAKGVKLHEKSEPKDIGDEYDRTQLQTELGQLTLQKQRLLFDISLLIPQLMAQQEAVESQRRHLNYVKSDISTDKTVCDISGNFMSSRDADERIAAHYAGKQYQGWKLVRDKYAAMKKKYGPYGPPPPANRGVPPPFRGPPTPAGGGRGYPGRGGLGGRDRPSSGRWERDRGNGGGFDRQRPPPNGPPRAGWR